MYTYYCAYLSGYNCKVDQETALTPDLALKNFPTNPDGHVLSVTFAISPAKSHWIHLLLEHIYLLKLS